MIYIDIVIVLMLLAYAWAGHRRGFLGQIFDLVGIVVSFFLALRYFNFLAQVFENWGINQNLSKPVGFFVLWLVGQLIFYLITLGIFHFIPSSVSKNRINHYLGLIPGLIKGIVMVAITLMLFFILPISPAFKNNLIKAPISGSIIRSFAKVETQMETVFSDLNNLNLFKVSQNEEMIQLDFKTESVSIDENSENAMLILVNDERARNGLSPLKKDYTIRDVARSHSIDMAKNGYFSHIDLAGLSPADRMTNGGVTYWLAGENIALAPTYELAEIGFMNSPKHRDNILDPKFGRIGIGIIDTGLYGKMVTQNFAD